MGEVSKKDWMESVQLVFDYFCERTPRCASALCAHDLAHSQGSVHMPIICIF